MIRTITLHTYGSNKKRDQVTTIMEENLERLIEDLDRSRRLVEQMRDKAAAGEAQIESLKKENELYLLQLHQMQEELEHHLELDRQKDQQIAAAQQQLDQHSELDRKKDQELAEMRRRLLGERLRFQTFQRCLEALKNNDFDAVESLLGGLQLSVKEPRAIALAKEIRNRALQKKLDLSQSPAANSPESVASPICATHANHNIEEISVEFSMLLRDAHVLNNSKNLVEMIKSGKDILVLRCEFGPCCAALNKTLDVLRSYYPSFAQRLVLVDNLLEHTNKNAPTDGAGNVFFASGELLDKLSARARGGELRGVGELVEWLASGNRDARYLSLSVPSLAREAILKAAQFSERLDGVFESSPTPVSASCLVTSLYDEHNLLRLIEYLACLVENLRVFERVVILYESRNGLLSAVVQEITEELRTVPGRLILLPYQKRPTFEELFSVKEILPGGTTIVVANADIAFDASFSKVSQVDLSRNIAVLSRYDISSDGRTARRIRSANGTPNTFSADVWIFKTPFEHDFYLDYPIGTFYCDSYINHQISRSKRYGAVNPCLDVRAFHLHDERFDSSLEKWKRDAEVIQKQYAHEMARNGNVDPHKGVAWTTAACAAIVPAALRFQSWKPKELFLELHKCSEPTFGHLMAVNYILSELRQGLSDAVVVIRIRKADLEGTIGVLLSRCQAHFGWANVTFDFGDEEFDAEKASREGTVCRTISFEDVVDWITAGPLEKAYEFFSWPAVNGVTFLRCEILGNLSTETTLRLLNVLLKNDQSVSRLFKFFNALPDYSAEKNMLAPFVVPRIPSATREWGIRSGAISRPTVSFITSLFNGGEFLPGYLENVLVAAREAKGEIIIIDANVDDHDSRVVMKFLDEHPDARNYIDYVKLDRDPGLYECWKIGIERARADLITNANIYDRRCPQHTARLVRLLNDHPEYAGACGSISCVTSDGTGGWFTLYDNQLWFFGEGISKIGFDDLYRVNERGEARSRDVLHCMPVWRKSLHDRYGYFDEAAYGTSADWAFWLKCTKAGEQFVFDEGAFGRCFLNPNSHNRRNDPGDVKELRIINDFIGIKQSVIRKQEL